MHCGRMRNDVSSMSNMTRHVKKVHEGERPYACTWEGCDKMFQARPIGTSISTLYILELNHLNVSTKAVAQLSQDTNLAAIRTVHENIKVLFVHGMGVLNVSRR
jgi:hypothetical protein